MILVAKLYCIKRKNIKKPLKILHSTILVTLFFSFQTLLGQHKFFADSLIDFDETAAKNSALSEGFVGNEFPVRMYILKRNYINSKYGLINRQTTSYFQSPNQRSLISPACQNEDFEISTPAKILSSNQILGWTVTGGSNNPLFNPGINSCNMLGCCPNIPSQSELIFAPSGGYIDPVIGSQYPIFSVFGSSPNTGAAINPQLGLSTMYGNKFIRLNDSINDYSMERLSKTFNVTASNCLFQFAFLSLLNTGHLCCDAGAFQIKVINASTNSVLACPFYSVSGSFNSCNTTYNFPFYQSHTFIVVTPTLAGANIYNKWNINAIDLTPYINQNITLEVSVTDCDAGGHFSYVYFDAQCAPFSVQNSTVTSCGSSIATITLPSGLGPYSWQGTGVPANYSTPSYTNQTYTTSVSGTLTATMNYPGGCAPFSKNITVSITPAPNLILNTIQSSCSNSVASISGTLTVGSLPMNVVTTGPSGTIVTNVTSNSLFTGSLSPGIYSISVTDGIGCNVTKTVQINPPLSVPNFSVGSPANDYTLTCFNTPITMTTSQAGLNYTWTNPSGTLTGNYANVSQQGIWQVIGQNTISGCSVVVTFTLYQNIISPIIVITPTVSNINCTTGPGCFTLTSNLGPNVTTNWFQVQGTNTVYVGISQGTLNIYCSGQPGVYWGESTNNLTGCKSTKSVQVTASIGVPVFTVTSPTNFTIGCSTTSITSMQVTSVITSPIQNVAVNYTFVPPAITSTPTTFTNNPNMNNIITPGTWVVYVEDQTNNCISSQSISIIQNTIAPNINYIQPLSILTCRDPQMILQGISSNSNTQITWTVPAIPSNSINPTPNSTVTINLAIIGSTANITSVGIFTVGAIDNNNLCVNGKTVQVLQDIRLPKFTISALTNSVINCINPDVVIVPLITPTLAVALVPTYEWYSPVGNSVQGSQFNTTAAGTHTSISTSVVNGCTYSATYIVASDLVPPSVDFTPIYTLDCGNNQATITTVATPTNDLTYYWNAFPPGVVVTNRTKPFILGSQIGEYGVIVTNTVNGCKTSGVYDVVPGSLNVDFTPNTQYGYSPLLVTFQNNSSSSITGGTMIATWSFGNGSIFTNTYTNGISIFIPTTTYSAAGSYSVLLNINKGTCKGTQIKIINVEIPSKLEVPNVFTPNGDKVNDVFRLITSSLAEVQASIFDRWGNKVYEVDSDTGNIEWNGKNQFGKDCPSGVYFYVIKANGKDGQEYNVKGNVSLFR